MKADTGKRAFVVALLGAESTGKTTLAVELGRRLSEAGHDVAVVGEVLRDFCATHGRTPRSDEQRGIADAQTRSIACAAAAHDIVIADTTALMIAVYSDQVFGDTGLYAHATASHRRCDLTLLTALDLPWEADGLQRDGPQVREPVDAKVRAALSAAALPFSVVHGRGTARIDAARASIDAAIARRDEAASDDAPPRWQWHCERCGDAACEAHALRRLADESSGRLTD